MNPLDTIQLLEKELNALAKDYLIGKIGHEEWYAESKKIVIAIEKLKIEEQEREAK